MRCPNCDCFVNADEAVDGFCSIQCAEDAYSDTGETWDEDDEVILAEQDDSYLDERYDTPYDWNECMYDDDLSPYDGNYSEE